MVQDKPILKKFSNVTAYIVISITLVSLVIIYLLHFKFDGNITGFFRIGENFPKSPYLETTKALIFSGEVGADGQQFLSIAFDPFLRNPDTIKALDVPVYRYRRILYPLLGYILSFGRVLLIPYLMVVINCVSIIIIILFSRAYLILVGAKPWQSLLVFCIPGVWLILSFSTAGLVSSAFFISSLYYYRTKKFVLAAILIAFACFTRETMLIVALSFFSANIYQQKWIRSLLFIVSLISWYFWNLYLSFQPKLQGGIDVVKSNFGYPFQGILAKFNSLFPLQFSAKALYELYSFTILCLVFLVLLYIAIKNIQFQPVIAIATIAYTLIFIFTLNTSYYLDYNRIFIDVYLMLLLSQTVGNNYLQTIKLSLFICMSLSSLLFLFASS